MKSYLVALLAGLFAFTLCACTSSASSSVKPEAAGGWSAEESHAVTPEIDELMAKASENIDGCSYTAAVYLETQVVAGRNHKILAVLTPVVPNAVSHYSIVTIYEDLKGNAEITEILDSEAEAGAEGLAGGWTHPETPDVTAEASAALEKAAKQLTGPALIPVSLLGTQTVAGTNYLLLCSYDADSPVTNYVIVKVYENLDKQAEVLDIYDFH